MKLKSILTCGECLAEMAEIPDNYVDMVMCDLPYGTTQNKWDSIIDLTQLWAAYRRICKPGAAIVLTAAQPFTSVLVCSNLRDFKYEWVWVKSKITGVLNAKKMPVRKHESVLIFCAKQTIYNPQGLIAKGTITKQGGQSNNYGARSTEAYTQEWTNWPRDVLEISSEGKCIHPTQKPIALIEYMIKTYTDPGMMVLDNCMGSGTTGVAAVNLGRSFIGIEQNPNYFAIAEKRIADAK
jgi:site-specific DNA-methyltransferase (adenine-specific)